VYKAGCWDCNAFYIGKTKRRLHDWKTEQFKALTSSNHAFAIADHMTLTGYRIKWDHFDILATGRSNVHCKIKETSLIRDVQPTLKVTVDLQGCLPENAFITRCFKENQGKLYIIVKLTNN